MHKVAFFQSSVVRFQHEIIAAGKGTDKAQLILGAKQTVPLGGSPSVLGKRDFTGAPIAQASGKADAAAGANDSPKLTAAGEAANASLEKRVKVAERVAQKATEELELAELKAAAAAQAGVVEATRADAKAKLTAGMAAREATEAAEELAENKAAAARAEREAKKAAEELAEQKAAAARAEWADAKAKLTAGKAASASLKGRVEMAEHDLTSALVDRKIFEDFKKVTTWASNQEKAALEAETKALQLILEKRAKAVRIYKRHKRSAAASRPLKPWMNSLEWHEKNVADTLGKLTAAEAELKTSVRVIRDLQAAEAAAAAAASRAEAESAKASSSSVQA